jgi:hypothetical protein
MTSQEQYNQLIDNAHKAYLEETMFSSDPTWLEPIQVMNTKTHEISMGARQYAKQGFIEKCKTDETFAKRWNLEIKEKELTTGERKLIYWNQRRILLLNPFEPITEELLNQLNIPTKQINIITNNQEYEIYI